MNEVAVAQPPTDASALMQIIARAATDATFDVAKLDALLAVKERWEAAEARKAFVAALNAFKADPPTITKNKHVGFESRREGGAKTDYWHATLDHVCDRVGEALSRHGLSHRWETQQLDKGLIRVTCILQHVAGHAERVTLEASADQSGNKNSIQAVGSTVTYLQRYTLLSATGMATTEQDDDGRGSEGQEGSQDETEQPWPADRLAAGAQAAAKGVAAYGAWWKAQDMDWRKDVAHGKQHSGFKAKASEVGA